MKNQNDMIIAIVAIVCGLIGVGVMFGTRPEPKAAAVPATVDLSKIEVKNADVPLVNGIGSGSNNNSAGGGGGPSMGGGRPTAAGTSAGGGGGYDPNRDGPMAAGTSAG